MAEVTCTCGAESEIADPSVDAVGIEVRWKCETCGATNLIEGKAGIPGEGTLNPAAAALSDDALAEAYDRRIHAVRLSGSIAPEGAAQ